jgi:hypothetical protein
MTQPTDFQKAYFLQTRQEIDTDKKIRDTTLNMAVLVLGGVAFAVFKGDNTLALVRSTHGFCLNLAAVVIVTALCYARREKMRQISDRWCVLFHLLRDNPNWLNSEKTLESIVLKGFRPPNRELQRYITKDFWLNVALCSPLLVGIFVFSVLTGVVVGAVFLSFAMWLHLKRIKDPFAQE